MGGGESFWVNLGGIPPELRPLVTRCLDRDPGVRPTAAEFRSVVAAAHPALLSPGVAGGQVRGPITWPDHDPDAIIEPAAPVSTVVPVSTAGSANGAGSVSSAGSPGTFASMPPIAPVHASIPARSAARARGPRSGRPHMPGKVVALFVAAVALALIGMAANNGSSGPSTTQGWLFLSDYQPGDCLAATYPLGSGVPWPEPAEAVPCTQPHAFEVFYANPYFWSPEAGHPFPPEPSQQAHDQCFTAFSAYVGVSPGLSRYGYTYVDADTTSSWVNDLGMLECVAYAPDPNSTGLELMITHSIQGTRQ
jgi:hypothetical protein